MKAMILGCAGLELAAEEKEFFRRHDPLGFILFARNCEAPEQIAKLVRDLRASVRRDDAPVLIDQEGGRVQRLGPPHWPKYPPGRAYGELKGNDPLLRREIARLGARLLADDLAALGINVDCVPVLDVPTPGAHDIIGDRAYGDDVATVATLGRAAAEGLIAGGVLPVIKHMPGHGRAAADSHHDLPVVDASLEALDGASGSIAGIRICAVIPIGMSASALNGAKSVALSSSREALMTGSEAWLSTPARPCPGMCLITGSTPPAR